MDDDDLARQTVADLRKGKGTVDGREQHARRAKPGT
jgi:stalled ribosome alternative rescue factor ArfA